MKTSPPRVATPHITFGTKHFSVTLAERRVSRQGWLPCSTFFHSQIFYGQVFRHRPTGTFRVTARERLLREVTPVSQFRKNDTRVYEGARNRETTLPLDGRDGRSRVWWGFKKSRAGIAFWPPPHNSRRSGEPCRSSERGGQVNCGRCGRRGRTEPPVTRPPPDDLPRA